MTECTHTRALRRLLWLLVGAVLLSSWVGNGCARSGNERSAQRASAITPKFVQIMSADTDNAVVRMVFDSGGQTRFVTKGYRRPGKTLWECAGAWSPVSTGSPPTLLALQTAISGGKPRLLTVSDDGALEEVATSGRCIQGVSAARGTLIYVRAFGHNIEVVSCGPHPSTLVLGRLSRGRPEIAASSDSAGEWVAVTASGTRDTRVWVIHVDGEGVMHRVHDLRGRNPFAQVDPDGRFVALLGQRPRLLNVQTGSLMRLPVSFGSEVFFGEGRLLVGMGGVTSDGPVYRAVVTTLVGTEVKRFELRTSWIRVDPTLRYISFLDESTGSWKIVSIRRSRIVDVGASYFDVAFASRTTLLAARRDGSLVWMENPGAE